jgi:hypothetical protein
MFDFFILQQEQGVRDNSRDAGSSKYATQRYENSNSRTRDNAMTGTTGKPERP